MKTTILKYDYYIQLALGVIDIVSMVCCWFIPYVIIGVQLLIGFYQLCSSGTHLLLQHKSIGFTQWRMKHFFGSLIYLVALYFTAYSGAFNGGMLNSGLFIIAVVIVPQAVLFAYIILCKRELDFIEEREFHILK